MLAVQSTMEANIERIAKELGNIENEKLTSKVRSGDILDEPAFSLGRSRDLAAFYAPFDWINEDADIVLVGVTPGKLQAEIALATLRHELRTGTPIVDAMRAAKQSASFAGEMRTIAGQLLDHFRINDLFGLSSASELFGSAKNRVHYTSVYRYPVLKRKGADWINYSGGTSRTELSNPLLQDMVRDYLIPELWRLPHAWLIPFGPTPATILAKLAKERFVDANRILSGLNHPSGQQRNRHNCQLDLVDHRNCAKNVGCDIIQSRSRTLHEQVARHLDA